MEQERIKRYGSVHIVGRGTKSRGIEGEGEVEERILDAAAKVFLERDFEGARVDEIADVACRKADDLCAVPWQGGAVRRGHGAQRARNHQLFEIIAPTSATIEEPDRGWWPRTAEYHSVHIHRESRRELKERIVHRVHESLGDLPGLAEMFVGTIHALTLELLKSEVPKYIRVELLSEVQQSVFVDRHSKRSALTACTDLQGAPLQRYKDTQRYLAALDILREADRSA